MKLNLGFFRLGMAALLVSAGPAFLAADGEPGGPPSGGKGSDGKDSGGKEFKGKRLPGEGGKKVGGKTEGKGEGKTGKKSDGNGDDPGDDEGDDPDDGKADGKTEGKAEGKAAAEKKPRKKYELPPSMNLKAPAELSEKVRLEMESAASAYNDAEKATERRDRLLTEAILKLRNASQKATKAALPFYYLGRAFQFKMNLPEAKKALEKAVKLKPDFYEAMVELGDVYLKQNDFKASVTFYDQALKLEPRFLPAMENKGTALIQLRNFAEAKTYYQKVFELEPSPTRAWVLRQIEAEMQGPKWGNTYRAETENYIILTPVSQEFANEISRHAELIRRAYNKVFPDVGKPSMKYPIWIYGDQLAFHKAGAPPGMGGYYDPILRKLVLYRYPKKEDTILVLHHEAFHQYLQDYVEMAPQWFNEGMGDYFGPYEYVREGTNETMYPHPNRWRMQTLRNWMQECPPASDLMLMSRQEMYSAKAPFHYAEAWAIIYFCLECTRFDYRKVLVSYFKAIRKGQGTNEAYNSTFGRLDMQKFDSQWRAYIMTVPMK